MKQVALSTFNTDFNPGDRVAVRYPDTGTEYFIGTVRSRRNSNVYVELDRGDRIRILVDQLDEIIPVPGMNRKIKRAHTIAEVHALLSNRQDKNKVPTTMPTDDVKDLGSLLTKLAFLNQLKHRPLITVNFAVDSFFGKLRAHRPAGLRGFIDFVRYGLKNNLVRDENYANALGAMTVQFSKAIRKPLNLSLVETSCDLATNETAKSKFNLLIDDTLTHLIRTSFLKDGKLRMTDVTYAGANGEPVKVSLHVQANAHGNYDRVRIMYAYKVPYSVLKSVDGIVLQTSLAQACQNSARAALGNVESSLGGRIASMLGYSFGVRTVCQPASGKSTALIGVEYLVARNFA